MIVFHPYNKFSGGMRSLKDSLKASGVPCITTLDRPMTKDRVVVNWGAGQIGYTHPRILNPPSAILPLRNKLTFFQALGNNSFVPAWTTDPNVARCWDVVVCRTLLTSSQGNGILIWDKADGGPEDPFVAAPLYTKYEKKTAEYRVHLGRTNSEGQIIDAQKKVFRQTPEMTAPKSWYVRNHNNGFIYIHSQEKIPDAVMLAAVNVMAEFPLVTFAAWDVIYHAPTDKAFVLEGNTAPGIEGRTVEAYTEYFKQVHKELLG